MAARNVRLYPGRGYQTLGFSLPLTCLADEPEFGVALATYGAMALETAVLEDERSWREIRIEPGIPPTKIQEFAEALLYIARAKGYPRDIAVWDHSKLLPKVVAHD